MSPPRGDKGPESWTGQHRPACLSPSAALLCRVPALQQGVTRWCPRGCAVPSPSCLLRSPCARSLPESQEPGRWGPRYNQGLPRAEQGAVAWPWSTGTSPPSPHIIPWSNAYCLPHTACCPLVPSRLQPLPVPGHTGTKPAPRAGSRAHAFTLRKAVCVCSSKGPGGLRLAPSPAGSVPPRRHSRVTWPRPRRPPCLQAARREQRPALLCPALPRAASRTRMLVLPLPAALRGCLRAPSTAAPSPPASLPGKAAASPLPAPTPRCPCSVPGPAGSLSGAGARGTGQHVRHWAAREWCYRTRVAVGVLPVVWAAHGAL